MHIAVIHTEKYTCIASYLFIISIILKVMKYLQSVDSHKMILKKPNKCGVFTDTYKMYFVINYKYM